MIQLVIVPYCSMAQVPIVDEMHRVATSLITRIAFDEDNEELNHDLFSSSVWMVNDMIRRPENNSLTFLDYVRRVNRERISTITATHRARTGICASNTCAWWRKELHHFFF